MWVLGLAGGIPVCSAGPCSQPDFPSRDLLSCAEPAGTHFVPRWWHGAIQEPKSSCLWVQRQGCAQSLPSALGYPVQAAPPWAGVPSTWRDPSVPWASLWHTRDGLFVQPWTARIMWCPPPSNGNIIPTVPPLFPHCDGTPTCQPMLVAQHVPKAVPQALRRRTRLQWLQGSAPGPAAAPQPLPGKTTAN